MLYFNPFSCCAFSSALFLIIFLDCTALKNKSPVLQRMPIGASPLRAGDHSSDMPGVENNAARSNEINRISYSPDALSHKRDADDAGLDSDYEFEKFRNLKPADPNDSALDHSREASGSESIYSHQPRNIEPTNNESPAGHSSAEDVDLHDGDLKPPARIDDGDLKPPARSDDGDLKPPARSDDGDLKPPANSSTDSPKPQRRPLGVTLTPQQEQFRKLIGTRDVSQLPEDIKTHHDDVRHLYAECDGYKELLAVVDSDEIVPFDSLGTTKNIRWALMANFPPWKNFMGTPADGMFHRLLQGTFKVAEDTASFIFKEKCIQAGEDLVTDALIWVSKFVHPEMPAGIRRAVAKVIVRASTAFFNRSVPCEYIFSPLLKVYP